MKEKIKTNKVATHPWEKPIKTDKRLDELHGKVMFPEKLARANEMLKNADLSALYKGKP